MSSMLKQIRLDSGKTLNQVSSDLKIRKKYLVALEEGDFDVLPGEVYVRGYLKLYLDYLNVKDRNAEQIEATKQDETEKLLNNKRATVLINYKRKKQLVLISIIMLSIIIVSHPFIINA
ncbi:helix-turn-helix domain-containing protein [Candidatus Rickettsia tasmanensis]